MKKNIVKKAAAKAAVQTAESLLSPIHVKKEEKGNVWKCVSFLLIGLIGGYLLSPTKGGILIGSFNGAHASFPSHLPFHPELHRHGKKKNPFSGGVYVGSFNGTDVSHQSESPDQAKKAEHR